MKNGKESLASRIAKRLLISPLVVAVSLSAAAPAAYATVPAAVVQNAVGLPDGVLYYVDGQKVSKEVAEKMNPASIAMVNVIKGATVRQIVGNVPEKQVILITTKGNENAALVVELNKKLNRSVDLTNKLLLVDGQQVTLTEMERLLPSQLQQVTVLSADDAMKAYGEKGKNGSVSITTK